MKKLLWVALILGLILARKLHAESPPLPPDRGLPPADAPGTSAKGLVVVWVFDLDYLDVLEISPDIEFSSSRDILGPYEIRDIDGTPSYYVSMPVGYADAFFRVRRDWGCPWVL